MRGVGGAGEREGGEARKGLLQLQPRRAEAARGVRRTQRRRARARSAARRRAPRTPRSQHTLHPLTPHTSSQFKATALHHQQPKQVDPYFVTQDNGAGAPLHFAVTYRQLDMVRGGGEGGRVGGCMWLVRGVGLVDCSPAFAAARCVCERRHRRPPCCCRKALNRRRQGNNSTKTNTTTHNLQLTARHQTNNTKHRHQHKVHHLLNLGALVNQRDGQGWTPLHRAAHLAHLDGYPEIYEYLLVMIWTVILT